MTYTLTFKCHAKSYAIDYTVEGAANPIQYEAVAHGLLLSAIKSNNLSRNDVFVNVYLIEQNETIQNAPKIVWWKAEYVAGPKTESL